MAKQTLDQLLNDLTFRMHFERFKELAINMFEWTGLPEGIKPYYIESVLFEQGKCLIFKDPKLSWLALPCNGEGGVNVYGEYQKFRAIGVGYSKTYSIDNCVEIRNNTQRIPTQNAIMVYVNRLTNIERTIDVNVLGQQTPYILSTDPKTKATLKAIFERKNNNEPAIYVDREFNMKAIDMIETLAPYVADKLTDLRHDQLYEALSCIGINNANTDKRERMIVDEVNSNNEYIKMCVDYMLQARKMACEEMAERLNLNVDVKLKNEVQQADEGGINNDVE